MSRTLQFLGAADPAGANSSEPGTPSDDEALDAYSRVVSGVAERARAVASRTSA